ncbi:MAG TPA: TadE/TadG family type IV pilus assembly protein [Alphaproteobacteria bacterium]|nr:TadE/TadG family type IV pilus assembly protein [Alphaproteobacteria bacterium]
MRRLLRDSGGNALAEFGLILPVLLIVTFGAIEFTITMLDYHRFGEAARRGARQAIISAPVAKLETLQTLGTIICTKTSSISCGSAAMHAAAAANFNAVLAAIQEIAPTVDATNLSIIYSWSGIGDLSTPGGIKPNVTVQLAGITHEFMLLSILPSVDYIVLPSFSTSVTANAYTSS